MGGNDTVGGGLGSDTIVTSTGNDLVFGGKDNGADNIDTDGGNDTVWAGAGDDTIDGGANNDRLGGGAGNDHLYDGEGNDVVFGGSGNDTVTTGEGHDTYYGGEGNDRLNLSGVVDDVLYNEDGSFTILMHNGDEKTAWGFETVSANGDTFHFDDFIPEPDDIVDRFGTLADASLDQDGYTNFGDGNTGDNFLIETNETQDVEVGLKIHLRGGDDFLPTSIEGNDAEYDVPTGDAGRADRSAWSFDYSVNTDASGNGGQTLAVYEVHLYFDIDPTEAVNYVELSKLQVAPGNTPLVDDPNAPAYGFEDEDGSSPFYMQNAGNYGFDWFAGQIDMDPNTAGIQPYDYSAAQFDILLVVSDEDGVVAQVHDVINVFDAP